MPLLPPHAEDVPKAALAALLLAAASRMAAFSLPHPTTAAILEATGASRSRGYELKKRLDAILVDLAAAAGRPRHKAPQPPAPTLLAKVRDFLIDHPGCVTRSRDRRCYSDAFRCFVLDVADAHPQVSREVLADALAVPLGTLKDWLAGGSQALKEAPPAPQPDAETPSPQRPRRQLHIETVLSEWRHWDGSFVAFCDHLQQHCGIPFGRTLIARVLEADGVRLRKKRPGRSPDEQALRKSLETFFPHAQWVGDGTVLPVEVDGELHVFNLELDVDAYSGAFVGAHVSKVEDSAAVLATFRDAIESTGHKPLALLLDNKPSNHTDAVHEALDGTMLIRATPYRPQNKAHCEGAFGLLAPTLEGVTLRGSGSPAQLAASFLEALVTAAARAINHRPRRDRGGRSRADLLDDTPSEEEIERARAALTERLRKQQRARETRAARQDPVVRSAIAQAYEDLVLDDPDGHLLTATARYPLHAVLEGTAIFKAARHTGTLPQSADARYLLGIVRNITREREGWQLALELWNARVAASDQLTIRLRQQKSDIDDATPNNDHRIHAYVDGALRTDSRLQRFFWLTTAADAITLHDPAHHERLFKATARRILATQAASHRQRTEAIRFLASRLRPVM